MAVRRDAQCVCSPDRSDFVYGDALCLGSAAKDYRVAIHVWLDHVAIKSAVRDPVTRALNAVRRNGRRRHFNLEGEPASVSKVDIPRLVRPLTLNAKTQKRE
jgi:hypothetical protein